MIMPEVPESSLAIHHSISRGRPTTQRDMMRQIYRRHGDRDDDSIIREYADAERRGDVQRIAMYITYRRKIMLAACWLMEVRGDGFKARPISMATMGILED